MFNRRAVALFATLVVVAAACGGSGATTAPATQAPATQAPATQAPATEAPVTQAPATEAPMSEAPSATACKVGVSWNNFQQPRWAAHDQPNIKSTVEAAGGTYLDFDANLSNEQQATDIQTMLNQGVNVLIVLAQDTTAVTAVHPGRA